MRTVEVTPQALAFSESASKLLADLYGRWQDEKEYEHIDTYMQPFSALAEKTGVQLVRMTKRPFAVQFTVGEKRFHLYCNGRVVGYKRLG